MQLRYPVFVIPVGIAVAANLISLAVHEIWHPWGIEGVQVLLGVSILAAGLGGVGSARAEWTTTHQVDNALGFALMAGLLGFIFSWVPVVVMFALNPPT